MTLRNPGVARMGNELTLPFTGYKAISRLSLQATQCLCWEQKPLVYKDLPPKAHRLPDIRVGGTQGGPWWLGTPRIRATACPDRRPRSSRK